MDIEKCICIHGHFYQPPRENPWLEEIELQDSAYPYRDWNERITAECYGPNTASRILDSEKKIIDIVNNYSKISFNFGPTLLSWMEKNAPKVYKLILESDDKSRKRFSGHGAAIAQAYNHMILPLSNERDKRTQILWGIEDFRHRFKREPEGMWLPETAVDLVTLNALASAGIKFTILSPYQARRIKKRGHKEWHDIDGGKIDPKMPYLCRLPSGKKITIFFYDGHISQDVAFGDLLKNGEEFARRMISTFPEGQKESALIHIANDGETFGHHHKFGNMALSYLLDHVEKNNFAKITVYGEYLEKYPPVYEVEIIENSSWSCMHGIERWRSDCGCRIKEIPGWNQQWREHLRKAMDWLRDELITIYEERMPEYVNAPWKARDEYIHILLDRSSENIESFLKRRAHRVLKREEKSRAIALLEMQRHAMLMYTSCGWFFDDASGIETIQIIQYAARAIQIVKDLGIVNLEEEYVKLLGQVKSNVPEMKDGRQIYDLFVGPAIVDLLDVGAHYAISSLFEEYSEDVKLYCYTIHSEIYDQHEAGLKKLVIGRIAIHSEITLEERMVNFAVLHLGDHTVTAGVGDYSDDAAFNLMKEEIENAFEDNIAEVISLIEHYFSKNKYSLWDLFRNEQGKVMNKIFEDTLKAIEGNFRQIYDQYHPLLRLKNDRRTPLPKVLAMVVEFVLNRDICEALEKEEFDIIRLERIAREIKQWPFMRDKETVSLIASRKINTLMQELAGHPMDIELLKSIESGLRIFMSLSLNLQLWKAQDLYFAISRRVFAKVQEKAGAGDEDSCIWIKSFNELGDYLKAEGV